MSCGIKSCYDAIDDNVNNEKAKNKDAETVTKSEALLRVYQCLNVPVSAGKQYVKYNRSQIDAVFVVLKQLMELEGFLFKQED